MTPSNKPAPTFDRSFLIELGGGLVYQQAEKLFEAHAVQSSEWKSPLLVGRVKGLRDSYQPQLNLRSTVFAECRCNCPVGRKNKVCAHAIAVALHYEAVQRDLRREATVRAVEASHENTAEEAPAQSAPRLKSIKLDPNGEPLRMLVFLPPNLEAAVERDAIVVKLDVAVGREIMPLNKLKAGRAYAPGEGQERAMGYVEQWCGGKLAGLLQLTNSRLNQLLGCLEGEPVVYWVKKPSEPIAWKAGKLEGVHSLLKLSEDEPAEPAAEVPVAKVDEDPVNKPRLRQGISLREPSSTNRRREVEAGAFASWKTKGGDFPVAGAKAQSDMSEYPSNRVIIDGSMHFIAVRLPTNDDGLQPLRRILKNEGFMLEPSNRKWWLRDRHKALNFLAGYWRTLKEDWRALFTDNFETKMKGIRFSELDVRAKEEGGTFKLEINLTHGGEESGMRRAIATGKNYLEDEAGQVILLDRSSVDRLHQIEKAVSGQADRPFTPTFSRQLNTAELVDAEELIDELVEGWQPPEAWQSRSRALKEVGALEQAPVRPIFNAILRSYQRIGVAWLWHLYRHDLGGILADEMGLGKTLQALALVECIRDADTEGYPALVVCPASLVENWMREAKRFVPHLKLCKHHGAGRAKEPVVLEAYDLIVTSYGTLRQDAGLLSTMDWCVVIGDEAQHIKNRRSQNARTLTSLHSKGRFLLTGTPVENSLDDLLSLFAFLMPGYLQKAPPQLSQEDRIWHSKRQTTRAAAYILRRTKKEVAPELPDKIEKTFFCELGARQTRFYQDTLEKTRREIFNLEMAGADSGRVRFAAFTELLRLRQACVDPRILDEQFDDSECAKLAAFDEIVDECLDNGSRLLVFSSFVTALKLLSDHLTRKRLKFSYLDGHTKNRLAVCDQFNEDESIPVFLISLKAGGTGLNLTGADTVLHYDPWWNPAAEAQATDRAHRIGQTKVVTSIKLIAANTIEEKVLELQARKAELLNELFEESAAANAKVSLEDLKSLLDD
ncbi:DEAD/DEAH box helicase [Coraliomargarita parva]|uniref:DEAD/DEAH box helicase n=1 Tax=Coraliomargarita parva TaxID=3014050 RepID=UPI0022B5318D|nr:DEAD/DEAH box helicase [Coraliomargarita parva]